MWKVLRTPSVGGYALPLPGAVSTAGKLNPFVHEPPSQLYLSHTTSSNGVYTLEYPTGTPLETVQTGTGAGGVIAAHDGVNVGLKLTTGQTISIVLAGDPATANTSMEIIEVDTGVSPKLT